MATIPIVLTPETMAKDGFHPGEPVYRACGEALDFVATFSEVVTVTGAPVLTLDVGGVARQALLLPEVVELDEPACDRIEARLAESQARLDANEARYRLLLDAHALWSLDDDADHEH